VSYHEEAMVLTPLGASTALGVIGGLLALIGLMGYGIEGGGDWAETPKPFKVLLYVGTMLALPILSRLLIAAVML
jgi:hypothetical protein